MIEQELLRIESEQATPNILIGYSAGARAALLHALSYPTRWDALVLISPSPGLETEELRRERRMKDAKLAQRILDEGLDNFLEFWQSTPLIKSQEDIAPEWRADMQQNRQRHTAHGLATSLLEFGQGSCPNLWSRISALCTPTLLITGEQDSKYTQMGGRITSIVNSNTGQKTVEHRVLPAGHAPHFENPEATAHTIDQFVKTTIG